MRTATAETYIECWVTCPYCDEFQNRFDDLHEHFTDEPRAEDIEAEIRCEDCKELFIVTEITY